MKLRKDMRALSLLMVLALIGAIFVPVVSAESIISRLSNDAEIQLAAPPTLSLNIDEDAQYRESLLTLKDFFQSENESKEYSEIIKLIDGELLKKEITNEDFLKIIKIVDPYLPDSHQINAKWSSTVHKDMAYDAGDKMGLSALNAIILYNYADDADLLFPPFSSWDHYATTGAPLKAELYANWAIDNIKGGDETQGYKDLAYALHFMSDMSMPFHDCYAYLSEHAEYEGYVHGNWNTGHQYRSTMSSFQYYYQINDVSDSATYLSSLAAGYKSYITGQVNNNPDWRDDSILISDTRNCMEWASGYNRGLVKYVQDGI
jgi:hypothetical protein